MTTNYERIKSMTVDEMAEVMAIGCDYRECPSHTDCTGCYKQWLMQESGNKDE